MAMVFSRNLLFLHVPKAGGSSVSRYLFRVLPRPVFFVSPGHLGQGREAGLVHVPGMPHQVLAKAGDLVRNHGFDLASFPLILAVVRNPYDLVVSHYAYLRRQTLASTLIAAREAPPRPTTPAVPRRYPELDALVAGLAPGTVARIEPTGRDKTRIIRRELNEAAAHSGRPLETWEADGIVYAGLLQTPPPRNELIALAETAAFREFVLEERTGALRTWLRQLHGFYHLDGAMPPNLRIARFERLADDVQAALAEIGIRGEAEFPWLNRSARGAYAEYYDAETEAVVYEQAKWLFEAGFYSRLDLTAARTH